MSYIVTRLYYNSAPLRGAITVSEIHGLAPVKYQISLFHDSRGCLVNKREFKTYQEAVHEANNFGFMTAEWNFEHSKI